jgi:hypothetical protein
MTPILFGHDPLKRFLHSSYSPDVSRSDFSLFEKVKSALVRREISDEIDLVEGASEILNRSTSFKVGSNVVKGLFPHEVII